MARANLVVSVPARNECERLPALLGALAFQTYEDAIVLLSLNNTTDQSRDVIDAVCKEYCKLNVIVDVATFEANDAHAGSARGRAMDVAVDIAAPDGLIVTTDADARPPRDWLAKNLSAISRGLDIVGGRIVIDEAEPLDSHVAAARALADRYWARVCEYEDRIDPVAWDLPPRHGDHTGASLCVTVEAYRRSGGVPVIPVGEDRALVQAIVKQGGRLAHPAEIRTRVSPRIHGRATGGMAEHMKLMTENSHRNCNVLLPSFKQWQTRARWRRNVRKRGGAALVAELEESLPPMIDDMMLNDAAFGRAL